MDFVEAKFIDDKGDVVDTCLVVWDSQSPQGVLAVTKWYFALKADHWLRDGGTVSTRKAELTTKTDGK